MSNNEKILEYIAKHRVAALSTADQHGVLHSAAVYVYAQKPKTWFMLSKQDTKKMRNLCAHSRFSAVIYERYDNSTLQARGVAEEEKDADTIGEVMAAMARIYGTESDWLPPIAKFKAGGYVVMRLDIEWLRFTKFGGESAGSENIFIEM